MIMEIKIDKGIPLPVRKNSAGFEKYPLSKLEVGDSFAVKIQAAAIGHHVRKAAKALGRKFVVRSEGTGSRVWRKS
jgi:hypothetical protein